MFFSLQTAPINLLIEGLLHVQKPDEEVFFVGGVVRDLILQRPIDDIDLAVIGSVRNITKRLADYLDSPFFILNETFNAARIIWKLDERKKVNIDLVEIRGNSIQEDLILRDFTINSLALNVRQPDKIIDPCNGLQDLQQHIIRGCSDETFENDPVRVLRAIRQSVKFGFRIEPNTLRCLKCSVPKINSVSIERIRDELFKVLNMPNPYQTINIFNHLKILDQLFPELFQEIQNPRFEEEKDLIWQHTLKVVRILSGLLRSTLGEFDNEKVNDLYTGEIVLNLKIYRHELDAYFKEMVTGERSRQTLLYLAGLFHDSGKFLLLNKMTDLKDKKLSYFNHDVLGAELVKNVSIRYALSTKEATVLEKVVNFHMALHLVVKNKQEINPRWIYRFIKRNRNTGIMLIYLSLADTLAQIDHFGMDTRLFEEIKISRKVLDAYFGQDDRLRNPPQYLNGHEIMLLTGLTPGPILGRAISKLEEETAINTIKSKAEAIDFIKMNFSIQK